MATRVKRRTQAQRLAALEAEHEAALDKIGLAMFGKADKREVAFRNTENARARRQAAGLTRTGRRSGYTGRKSRERQTVSAERRREAEKRVEAFVRDNPSHPVAQAWTRRTREIDELRAASDRGFLGEGGAERVKVKAYCVKAHTRKVRVRVG